jgi:CO/xanthine dehydrogenase Mo-binding subunit
MLMTWRKSQGQSRRSFDSPVLPFVAASFKIWNSATVGGNICMALRAGALISLATAREGVVREWGYDTGRFGSAGTVVAGKAVEYVAVALRDRILNLAAKLQDTAPAKCRITLDAVVCDGSSVALIDLAAAACSAGQPLEVVRNFQSVAGSH